MSGIADLEVTDDCLRILKSNISREWRELGRWLGLSEETLDNVEKERRFEGHATVCYGVLLKWKRQGKGAKTYGVLADALEKSGRRDLADKLLKGQFDKDSASEKIMPAASNNIPEVSKKFRADPGTESGASSTQRPATSTTMRLPHYPMNNKIRGKCLILTYDKFWDGDTLDEEWNRLGNDIDTKNLEDVFSQLGFDVDTDLNLKKEDTMKTIEKLSKKRKFDSFILFVCSHGNEKSFYTSDKKEIDLQDVITPFKVENCHGFADKPKMFFFNTCRGKEEEKMVKYEKDQVPGARRIGIATNISYYRPNEADFLVVLSTVPGYVSWRNTDTGTCFVESLCSCLKDHYETYQLTDILVMNNKTLLEKFGQMRESVGICQVPTIILTLSKAVYFVD